DAAGDRGETTMKSSGALKVSAQSDRDIVMTRVFDAPRSLVFDAYTKPELLKRWLGVFGGYSMPVCEVDLRVGGTYRFVWRGPDGAEMGVRGVYREVVRPEGSCTPRSSTRPGIPVSRSSRPFLPNKAARPRSRSPCATSRGRPATPSSSPRWRAESRRATTSSPSCWRRAVRKRHGDERNASSAAHPPKHRRRPRRRACDLHSLHRDRCGAERNRCVSLIRAADVGRALPAGNGVSHHLWRRDQLPRVAARSRSPHAA